MFARQIIPIPQLKDAPGVIRKPMYSNQILFNRPDHWILKNKIKVRLDAFSIVAAAAASIEI